MKKLSSDKSEIAKEMKRSDGLWRFAYGNVFICF